MSDSLKAINTSNNTSNNTCVFIVLFLLTREWTSVIITGLMSKGFTVSAGFDPETGKMYCADDDKSSHTLCLKITRKIAFTRKQAQDLLMEVLKANDINIFGGIISFSGEFNVLACTIKQDKIETHPYR
jgi:hypothetical protein